MTATEILTTITQYGLPLIALVFLVWKAFPITIQYLDKKTKANEERVDKLIKAHQDEQTIIIDKHRKDQREIIERHETRMETLIDDYKKHTEATNKELSQLQSHLPTINMLKDELKKQNNSIEAHLLRTEELMQKISNT